MSNCIFGWPIYSDAGVSQTPVITSGSFLAALPASNVADRRLAKIGRSTDATVGNTQIIFDLGVARAVGVLAVLIPNLTKSATPTVHWEGASDAGFSSIVYDSGALQAWPTGVTAEDAAGADGQSMNVWSTHVPSSLKTARYWACLVSDTANADGYLNFARIIIAGAFQPAVTMNDGDHFGEESESARNLTDGGAAVYTAKRQRRTHQFGINNLTSAESLATLRRMKRQLGTSQQFMWIPDPADTTYAYERNYLATLRSLSPLESFATRYNSTFEVVEEL